jgi:2-hydroxy-6-oxonona-2,4-dienedioate hydrolase
VDRPGCGLSEPPSEIPDATTLSQYVEQLTEDLLDAASLPRAVLVGSSFGGYSALRSAAALPDRIQGVFLAGCPPFIPGWNQIPYFTMLRAPVLGRLMVRMPASSGTVRMALRQMGQARALRDKAIPSAMLDWERAWQNHTDTLRNDAAMIRRCGSFTGGFDPRVELGSEDLSRVGVPVHVLVGTADPIGGEAVGRRLTDLLPLASLEVWEGAGHLPWLDDPERLARTVQEFTRSAAPLKG